MAKEEVRACNGFNGPLVIGILGIIFGTGLLLASKYMLTAFTISAAQTNRANLVNDIGRVILIISILIAAAFYVKRLAKDILSK
jgi:hypothetical protein